MSIHVPSTRALPLAAVMLAGCLAASACGGSSGKTSGTATTNATAAAAGATGSTPSAAGGGSTGSAHSGSPSSGSGSGGSSSSGSGSPSGGSSNSSSSNPSSSSSTTKPPHGKYTAQLIAAVKTFATCVRGHGVPLKEPNFSGHGEVFSDQGINTHTPQFEAAMQACESDLFAVLRAGGARLPGASG